MTTEGPRDGFPVEQVLSPNNFLSYLGATTQLYRLRARSLFLLFALGGIIVTLLSGALFEVLPATSRSLAIVFFFQLLILAVVGSVLSGRASVMLTRAIVGEPSDGRAVSASMGGAVSHLVAASMLSGLLVVVLTMLFQLIGALVGLHIMLGPPVLLHIVAIEKRSFNEALKRVRDLVRGQVLRTFLYLLCAGLLLGMIELVLIRLAESLVAGALDGMAQTVITAAVVGGLLGLGLSFMSVFNLIVYFDMRTRNENLELSGLKQEMSEGQDGADETDSAQ